MISFRGGFHGRTLLALSLTGSVNPYKQNFGPYAAEIYQAPFPYEYRGWSTERALASLESLFESEVSPKRVAAVIIEPVLGEGGFVPAPLDFLRRLRELTERHGILSDRRRDPDWFRTHRQVLRHRALWGCSRTSSRLPRASPRDSRCQVSSVAPRSWTLQIRVVLAAPTAATPSPARRAWR